MSESKREKPLIIEAKEALLRRLPKNHPKYAEISSNLQKRWKGYQGELQLDYYLGYLPDKEYRILRGLRLSANNRIFQLDTLVLSPNVLIIIESKNFSGTLFFDQLSNQFIRKYQDTEEGFSDPISQVKRHRIQLLHWLHQHKIKSCPIEYLISISSPSTLIKTNPGMHELFKKVIHAEKIPDRIEQLLYTHKEKCYSPYLLHKIEQQLVEQQHLEEINVLKKYAIQSHHLIKGALCPHCKNGITQRIHGTWLCPFCQVCSKDAHHNAIKDYLLLHHKMTNEQCRDFLRISSINLCTRLLEDMKIPFTGKGKYKVYYHT